MLARGFGGRFMRSGAVVWRRSLASRSVALRRESVKRLSPAIRAADKTAPLPAAIRAANKTAPLPGDDPPVSLMQLVADRVEQLATNLAPPASPVYACLVDAENTTAAKLEAVCMCVCVRERKRERARERERERVRVV